MTIRIPLLILAAGALAACDTLATTVEGWPEDGVTPATGTYEYRLTWLKTLAAGDTGTVKDTLTAGTLIITDAGTGAFLGTWGVSGYATADTATWDGGAYVLETARTTGTEFTVTHRLYRKDGVGSLTCEAAITADDAARPVNAKSCTLTRIRAAGP